MHVSILEIGAPALLFHFILIEVKVFSRNVHLSFYFVILLGVGGVIATCLPCDYSLWDEEGHRLSKYWFVKK